MIGAPRAPNEILRVSSQFPHIIGLGHRFCACEMPTSDAARRRIVAVVVERETPALAIGDLVAALRHLVLSARYIATSGSRDARLDLLRGFCVFAMVADH